MTAVAGGASTISKYPGALPANFPRLDPTRASGGRIHGTEGREYVDWISGLGPNLLGYGHLAVEEAVRRIKAPSLSLVSDLEERVADRVRHLAGFPDGLVRFFTTGSEGCSAAIRIARAVTGRDLVLSSSFHGWHSDVLAASPAWGVPDALRRLTLPFPFNRLDVAENACFGLDRDGATDDPDIHGDVVAAVIVQPAFDEPVPGFLQGLRALCDRFGILLVFDETITLLRYPEFSAAQHYGVQPDLLVGGKGLANGRPISAVVGGTEVMRCFELGWTPRVTNGTWGNEWHGPLYCSGTWAACADSLAAAEAVLDVWDAHPGAVARTIGDTGRRLRSALNTRGAEALGVRVCGPDHRLTIDAGDNWALRMFLLQELCRSGVLVSSFLMPCAAHTLADVGQTAVAWREATGAAAVLLEEHGAIPSEAIGGRVCGPLYRQGG